MKLTDGKITPDEIEHHLGNNAVAKWMAEEGTAMAAGPHVWYRHQLETDFEKYVARELRGLPEAERKLPLKNNAANLIDRVNERALKPNQRKLWNDAKALRTRTLKEIDDVYQGRETAQTAHETASNALRGRKIAIETALKRTTIQHWEEMEREAGHDGAPRIRP